MLALLLSLLLSSALACPSKLTLAVGSYTAQPWLPDAAGDGVSIFTLSMTLNKSNTIHPILSGANPSYIANHSSTLYMVNENVPATLTRIERSSTQPFVTSTSLATEGESATHVAVRGNFVFVANFGGSVTSFSRNPFKLVDQFVPPADLAAVNRDPKLDAFPFLAVHPHMVLPYGRGVIVPDLGASIVFYLQVSSGGNLTETDRVVLQPDDGPRHAALHSSGSIFVVTEKSLSILEIRPGCGGKPENKLGVCARQKLVGDNVENLVDASAAAIRITADERFVYASIRRAGEEEGLIVGFRINEERTLKRIGVWSSGGVHPRDFTVIDGVNNGSGCRSYVAVVNRDSDNLIMFQRNSSSGRIMKSRQVLQGEVGTPTSVAVVA